MKIAAAIPCYNGERFIGACIEAVLRQTRPADEVLVIEDGSTDHSAEVIARYPVRMISHGQNRGLAFGRNTALENTDADVLVYIDTDAYAAPETLAVLAAEYANPQVSGVGGQGIEAVQNSLADRWRGRHASQGHGPRRLERVDHLFGLCMSYRTEALRAVGGFDTRYRTNAEDVDMGLRLTNAGRQLVYTPQAVVYHQRTDSLESLRRAMYNWYYWGFVAKRLNRRTPYSLLAGTLKRLLLTDTFPDLFQKDGMALVRLDIELAGIKLKAIRDAARASQPLEVKP